VTRSGSSRRTAQHRTCQRDVAGSSTYYAATPRAQGEVSPAHQLMERLQVPPVMNAGRNVIMKIPTLGLNRLVATPVR